MCKRVKVQVTVFMIERVRLELVTRRKQSVGGAVFTFSMRSERKDKNANDADRAQMEAVEIR